MNRKRSSSGFSRARKSFADAGKTVIRMTTRPPTNTSWLTWAGGVTILFGATVGFLGVLSVVLNYMSAVAPGIALLALFILWIVTTVYLPPPRTTRSE